MTLRQKRWAIALPAAALLLVFGLLARQSLIQGAENPKLPGEPKSSGHSQPAVTTNAAEATSVARSAPLPVATFPLGTLRPARPSETYRGTLQASKQTDLAFRRSDRILEISVDEGAQVRQGQTLARLDAADVRAKIAANQADRSEAEAQLRELEAGPRVQTVAAAAAEADRLEASLRLAEMNWERAQQLSQTNAISLQQFDEARFAREQQEALLRVARENLSELRAGTRQEQIDAQRARLVALQARGESLQVDLRDTEIKAPYSGVIAQRYLDEGAIPQSGEAVLRLLQIDPLEGRFAVASEDAALLQPGRTVFITVDGRDHQAAVARVQPQLDLRTRTQAVVLEIRGEDTQSPVPGSQVHGSLVPGATATLQWMPASVTDQGYWVPMDALARSTRGLWSVMAVVPAAESTTTSSDPAVVPADWRPASVNSSKTLWKLERRDVRVLELAGRLARIDGASVSEGLPIVASGLHRVTAGIAVKPVAADLPELMESKLEETQPETTSASSAGAAQDARGGSLGSER